MDSLGENKLRDGGLMTLDGSGCNVNQVLYFIDKGIPVVACRRMVPICFYMDTTSTM